MDAVKVNDLEERVYTVEDIYELPDGIRAELIDGQIYYMATPSLTHQRLLMALSKKIANFIDNNHGQCEVLPAPFSVFLKENDNKNYLEPDISVICDKDKLDEKGCHGAPDWVIEIVSASSKPRDYIKKMIQYHMAGVREYWIVDHEKNHIIVYNFEHDTVDDYSFSEKVKAGIYEDFQIDFSEINIE